MLTLSSFVFQTYVFSSQLRFHLLLFPVIVGWMLLVQILKHLFLRSFRFYIFDILCIFLRFTFLSKIFFLHLVVTSCTYVFVFFVYLSLVLFAIKYLHFFSFFFVQHHVTLSFLFLLCLLSGFDSYVETFVTPEDLFEFVFFSFFRSHAFFKEKCETFVKNQAFNKKTWNIHKIDSQMGSPLPGPEKIQKVTFLKTVLCLGKTARQNLFFPSPPPPKVPHRIWVLFFYKNV